MRVTPPQVDGLRYLRRSLEHTLVASAFSIRRSTFATSLLPARAFQRLLVLEGIRIGVSWRRRCELFGLFVVHFGAWR